MTGSAKDDPHYVMLKDKLERIELRVSSFVVWFLGLGFVAYLIAPDWLTFGLIAGATVGRYAATGVSRVTKALRIPGLIIYFGSALIGILR